MPSKIKKILSKLSPQIEKAVRSTDINAALRQKAKASKLIGKKRPISKWDNKSIDIDMNNVRKSIERGYANLKRKLK